MGTTRLKTATTTRRKSRGVNIVLVEICVISAHFHAEMHPEVVLNQSPTRDALLLKFEVLASDEALHLQLQFSLWQVVVALVVPEQSEAKPHITAKPAFALHPHALLAECSV
jgi:hypothetical protein